MGREPTGIVDLTLGNHQTHWDNLPDTVPRTSIGESGTQIDGLHAQIRPTPLLLPLALAITACGGSDVPATSSSGSSATTPTASTTSSSSDAAATPESSTDSAVPDASSGATTQVTAKSGGFTIEVPADLKPAKKTYGADEVALAKDGRQVLVGAIPANKRASQLKKLRELCTTGAKEMGGSAISAKPRLIDGAKAEGCLLEVPKGDNGRAKVRGALLHGPAQWHRLRGDGCSQPVW